MAPKTLDEHIVATPGTCGGKPRIAGRRIKVEHVAVWHEQMGWTVDTICEQFDLNKADVHAALAYYHDHKDEIDRDMEEDREFVEKLRRSTPSLLAEKLRERERRGAS